MKKLQLLGLILLLVVTSTVYGQVNVPGLGMAYSALVRDKNLNIQPSKTINLRFTLLLSQSGTSANAPWVETQTVKTDSFGFANTTIGLGKKAGGTAATFADVDFSLGGFWLMIEVQNDAGKFEALAKEALQSVPYAKVAGAVVGGANPAGSVIAFAGDTSRIPQGWMLCDGRELDNTNPRYVALFKAIGYNWGTSNNANNFNIPDLQGYFIRGVDFSGQRDPEAAFRQPSRPNGNGGPNVGSIELDAFQGHAHNFEDGHSMLLFDIGGQSGLYHGNLMQTTIKTGNPIPSNYGDIRLSTETRPRNVNMLYIIKL